MQRQIMKEPTLLNAFKVSMYNVSQQFGCILHLCYISYVNMISLSYAGHEFEMQHKFMILTVGNTLRKLNVESWTLA